MGASADHHRYIRALTAIYRLSGMVFAFVLIHIASAIPATAGGSDTYAFEQVSTKAISQSVNAAVVRIFASEKDPNLRGTGFIVDSRAGLIVSANHVVKDLGSPVWVSMAGRDIRMSADVLENEESPDFTILKLNPRQEGLQSLEIQFDDIPTGDHRVSGYAGSESSPLMYGATPAPTKDHCKYTLRVETLHGDSGSAVLTDQALVDGIALEGAWSNENGVMALMKMLPLKCVRPTLLKHVPDDDTSQILTHLISGDEFELASIFQPPRRDIWFTNLRIAKALQALIDQRKGSPKIQFLSGSRLVEIICIITGRKLGMDLVPQVVVESGNSSDIGDSLHKAGDRLRKSGAAEEAKTIFQLAQTQYLTRVGSLLVASDKAGSTKSFELARLYKGAADVTAKLAQLSNEPEGGRYKSVNLYAAAAAYYAPKGALRASALATLGISAQKTGDNAAAVPALKAAVNAGATYDWTVESLRFSKTMLGDAPAAALSDVYLAEKAASANSDVRSLAYGHNPFVVD